MSNLNNIFKYLSVHELKKCMIAFVKMEIIVVPKIDSWLRLASFNKINDIYHFLIDNGSGDEVSIYIKDDKAFIKGFDHESDLSPYQFDDSSHILEKIYLNSPKEFKNLLDDENIYNTTFAMWNLSTGDEWNFNKLSNEDDGGREFLLGYIFDSAEHYLEWAKDYHDVSFDLKIINDIYNETDITKEMLKNLNITRDENEILKELEEFYRLL